jgi:hypothetical protein
MKESTRRNFFRMVHVGGAILNEVGPTRCRATPAWEEKAVLVVVRAKGGVYSELSTPEAIPYEAGTRCCRATPVLWKDQEGGGRRKEG